MNGCLFTKVSGCYWLVDEISCLITMKLSIEIIYYPLKLPIMFLSKKKARYFSCIHVLFNKVYLWGVLKLLFGNVLRMIGRIDFRCGSINFCKHGKETTKYHHLSIVPLTVFLFMKHRKCITIGFYINEIYTKTEKRQETEFSSFVLIDETFNFYF